jgi:hypothetical protein
MVQNGHNSQLTIFEEATGDRTESQDEFARNETKHYFYLYNLTEITNCLYVPHIHHLEERSMIGLPATGSSH